MQSEIIIAILSLFGTFIGSFSGMKLMSYRIEQLEKKVDKHNNFAERIPILEEKIAVANHRISDLEKEVESYNCRLNSLTFGEQSNTGLVNQISVNINITGDYTDIMRYCRDVVTGEKIRRIDTINMSPYASSDTKEADIVIVEFSR